MPGKDAILTRDTKSQTLTNGLLCNIIPAADKALLGPPNYCPGRRKPLQSLQNSGHPVCSVSTGGQSTVRLEGQGF